MKIKNLYTILGSVILMITISLIVTNQLELNKGDFTNVPFGTTPTPAMPPTGTGTPTGEGGGTLCVEGGTSPGVEPTSPPIPTSLINRSIPGLQVYTKPKATVNRPNFTIQKIYTTGTTTPKTPNFRTQPPTPPPPPKLPPPPPPPPTKTPTPVVVNPQPSGNTPNNGNCEEQCVLDSNGRYERWLFCNGTQQSRIEICNDRCVRRP